MGLFIKRPRLAPPCLGWREDLPTPDEVPVSVPSLGFDTPNHQDDIFLELPRSSALIRGVVIWFVPLSSFFLVFFLSGVLSNLQMMNFELWIMFLSVVGFSIWLIPLFWKFDVAPPRDLPLRFNRARKRLYAYNFKCRWWHPFERWRAVPVAYDWSQVRAERWRTGDAKCGVELSIVKAGTNEVIDRFPLTFIGGDAHAWAYVCTYMQQGPKALPPPGPPKDHNDVLWCNVAMRLAPKVEWPADMDLESRTAP
ncbi:DUF6708 domain-containing protein [Pseudomonas wadenswilerensis]